MVLFDLGRKKIYKFGFQLLFVNYLLRGYISNSSRKKTITIFGYNFDL